MPHHYPVLFMYVLQRQLPTLSKHSSREHENTIVHIQFSACIQVSSAALSRSYCNHSSSESHVSFIHHDSSVSFELEVSQSLLALYNLDTCFVECPSVWFYLMFTEDWIQIMYFRVEHCRINPMFIAFYLVAHDVGLSQLLMMLILII